MLQFGRCILTVTQTQHKYLVTGRELREVGDHLRREGIYYIAGANSIYVPSGRRKYIDKAVVKQWPDLEGQLREMTPGEAARTELIREWPDLKRVGWSPGHITLFDWRSPMHFTGPNVGRFIYIDLDAAYSQIYEKLWLDVAFPTGLYGRYPLANVASRLKDWKVARNSLVGLVRSRQGVAYRGQKRITLKMKNRFLSPGLWASVQATLHWIAVKAVSLGCLYINTDGYVFREDLTEFWEEFVIWLSMNQIRWSIRTQGEGEIVSWNNYNIGGKATKANQLNLTSNAKEFTNVNTEYEAKWRSYWGRVCAIRGKAS